MAAEQLSHDEVWDDSALVDSWNEALAEYKKYHSIAAKGERVEDILAAAEKAEEAFVDEPSATNGVDGLPEWEAKDEVMAEEPLTEAAASEAYDEQPHVQQGPQSNTKYTAMPHTLMNTVQDEGLKNLMMSWYYAGYYTGLYEGEQKALASHAKANGNGKIG